MQLDKKQSYVNNEQFKPKAISLHLFNNYKNHLIYSTQLRKKKTHKRTTTLERLEKKNSIHLDFILE